MKRPAVSGESALILLLTFAAFASVTSSLQMGPLLTALAEEFDKSESAIGHISAVSSLVGMAVALGAAPLLHRRPMRFWLQVQCLLALISVVLMSTAQSFEALVGARVIAGIGGGAFLATCFTAASEIVSDPSRTGRAVAFVASGTTLASLAGVPIVAQIREFAGWRWAAAFVAIPLTIVFVGAFWLPRASPARDRNVSGRGAIGGVLKHRATSLMLLAMMMLFITYFGWFVYYAAYVENDFQGGASLISALFIVAGLSELSGNVVAPGLLRRFAGYAVTIAGFLGAALALLGSGNLFATTATLFVAVALLNLCFSFLYVGSYTLLLESMPGHKATTMALASSAVALGAALGAFFGGELLDALGSYESMYQVLGVIMLLAAAAVLASRHASKNSSHP